MKHLSGEFYIFRHPRLAIPFTFITFAKDYKNNQTDNPMKKSILLLFAALLPLVASAQDFKFNNNSYSITSETDKTVELTYGRNDYSITVPATVTYNGVNYSVTSIGKSAFSACSELISITLPESVTSIGDRAFSGCENLTTINIPEGVTSIGDGAFDFCISLMSITLPEGVTSIGDWAFSWCSSLKSINIPEGVTSIGEDAFNGCDSLTAVHISSLEVWCNIDFANSNANPLYYAENLYLNGSLVTELTIPNSVTAIKNSTFSGCSSLTAITIPEGVTSIGDEAFLVCSNLTDITLPEGVTSIGYNAFDGCSSLTAINIPEGVTSIGERAFFDCSSLTTVVLPKSVKDIYSMAFGWCPELTDVYCYAETVPDTEASAFDGSNITLHVPASAINSYMSTAPWWWFGRFETLEVLVENITLNASTATLIEGEDLTLTAMVAPDDATDKSISWSSSNPSVAYVDRGGKVTAIVPGTATITATANDGSGVSASCEVTVTPASYVIRFIVDGEVILTDTLTRGSTINLPDVPEKEGYTFSGWGEVPETMPDKYVTVIGTFIINKYLVTFKVGDEVIAADSLEYGAAIVVPEAPEKEGYTFSGWGEVAETVPANDVTYSAYYIANVYKVHYFVGSKLVNMVEVTYGEPIPEYIYEPTTEGDEFLGWIGDTYETMPAHDVIYTANIYNGIDVMSTNNSQQSKVFYDLTGRRVTNPIKGGIYIINGRKVMIK